MEQSYYEKNKQRILERQRNYYQKNKEACKARHKKWTEENKERSKEHRKKWRDAHKDQANEIIYNWNDRNNAKRRMAHIKHRAAKRGIEFNLTIEDFENIPTHCPVLGIELITTERQGYATDNFASLDRIDNNNGYIKGNVIWISRKANTMKNNASLEELRKLLAFYEALISSQKEEGCTSIPSTPL